MLHPSLLVVVFSALLAVACGSAPGESPAATSASQEAVVEHIDGWGEESLDVYFVPGGQTLEDRIAQEIESAQHEIRVAMYNVRSARLGYALLERQQAGVAVEVLWDAKQMAQDYNTLDDELIAAGLNVVPVLNERHEFATLHHKVAIIDGERVLMGSANWSDSALHDNDEVVLVMRSPALAAVYDGELDEILTGWKDRREGDADSAAQLYFSPEDKLDRVIEARIDAAEHRIVAAVFSFRLSGLAEAMVRAKQRGVDVYLITDRKQSTTTTVDEILKDAGIPVIEALNDTNEFTAMHDKFMVVDGETTVVGSYNWTYTATKSNYEDIAVIADDVEVASAFEGAFGRLWDRYGQDDNPVSATGAVSVAAYCDGTAYGDTLVLVGDRPELGAWNPHDGVRLSGAAWPTWTGDVALRAGARIEYKLVIVRGDGGVAVGARGQPNAVVPTDANETLELGRCVPLLIPPGAHAPSPACFSLPFCPRAAVMGRRSHGACGRGRARPSTGAHGDVGRGRPRNLDRRGRARRGAWMDGCARRHVRYHKRVFVEVAAPYGGAWMRTLHVAQYRGPMEQGTERWGADTLEDLSGRRSAGRAPVRSGGGSGSVPARPRW